MFFLIITEPLAFYFSNYLLIVEIYQNYGECKLNLLIDEFVSNMDNILESKLGREESIKIQKELLDIGEEYIKAMKKEMAD